MGDFTELRLRLFLDCPHPVFQQRFCKTAEIPTAGGGHSFWMTAQAPRRPLAQHEGPAKSGHFCR
jgi:hypothetical protein